MLLSHKSSVRVNETESNLIGHMCYAAYKLWNICNYERYHYKELALPVDYPDWYYQKKAHKADIWYKQLPSQTAQEVCKLLDKSWRSFYALKKSGGIKTPMPPRYKHSGIAVTYMQNAVVHAPHSDTVRLTLSRQLKSYMSDRYGIRDSFLYLKNRIFKNTDTIKQIRLYPPEKGKCEIIVIYEIPDTEMLPDNGRYLGIDLGLHNLMTCYNSANGESFIAGRKYLSICNYYNKEIARIQSQWQSMQYRKGIKHPGSSKHISLLYKNKSDAIRDYLHKITRSIVSYCQVNDIHTVIIGDIRGIRKGLDFGHVTNQKMHSLPYRKLHIMLEYKLAVEGITMIRQKESYSSQTSPLAPKVSKTYAKKSNRVKRGLYQDGEHTWNADCVGAFNIIRIYLNDAKSEITLNPHDIKSPYVLKVAV